MTSRPPNSKAHSSVRPMNAYGKAKHTAALNEFALDLNAAVNQSLPSYDKPYGQVAVLALRWSNDDMGLQPIEKELLNVFRQVYGFNVENYVIPADDPHGRIVTTNRINTFISKWDAAGGLMIIVYSGHAQYVKHHVREEDYYISGSLAPGAPSISGTSLADILFHGIHGDILLILDTCYASVSACSLGPEVLAAAGWLDEAAANLDTSFTRALIEELKLLNGHPTTVAQLYSSIHRKGAEYNLLCNPVQIPQIGKSSIVLKKMTGPTQRKPESHEARMRKIDALEQSESRVLISVHLQDDIRLPDVEEWKRWLTINVPSRVLSSDISIEAAFKTKSSLLLMAIPFEVWTMLKADNEAYKFVSFVDSTASIPRTTLVLGKTAPAVKSVPASSSGLASGSVLATIQLGQRSRPKPDENTPPPGYTVRTELPLRKHGI